MNVDEYDFQYACGLSMNLTLENRTQFASSVAYHYVINANMAALTQLRKGLLETLELKRLATRNASMLWSLLAASEKPRKLTSVEAQDLFSVTYSPVGSNKRQQEETIAMYFYTFLQECEGIQVLNTIIAWRTYFYSLSIIEIFLLFLSVFFV